MPRLMLLTFFFLVNFPNSPFSFLNPLPSLPSITSPTMLISQVMSMDSNDWPLDRSPSSPRLSSPSFTPTQLSSDSLHQFETLFSRFLKADGVVLALWDEAIKDKLADFPRHYYKLCSASPTLSRLGLRAITLPTSLERDCFALETHLSFYFHTTAHTYLHSSVGTFAKILESTPVNSPEDCLKMLSMMVKILLFSSLEIADELSSTFCGLLSHVDANQGAKVGFFMKMFFSNFIASCLDQPQVILAASLSTTTINWCFHFSTVLRAMIASLLGEQQGDQRPQLPTILQQAVEQHDNSMDHMIKQLHAFSSFILSNADDEEEERKQARKKLWDGMVSFYLPLWETHHLPCKRNEGDDEVHKHGSTCSMKEPTLSESFKFFADYLQRKKNVLLQKLEGNRTKGKWSLSVGAVSELGEWMVQKTNQEGVQKEEGAKRRSKSPIKKNLPRNQQNLLIFS